MNKKITGTALAALMIAGSTSFSAFAAMSNGTVVIGNKAFDIDYANAPANATEIQAAILAGGTVYVKDYNGNWTDNVSGASVNASVIPVFLQTIGPYGLPNPLKQSVRQSCSLTWRLPDIASYGQ
jgi:hypothetical protein